MIKDLKESSYSCQWIYQNKVWIIDIGTHKYDIEITVYIFKNYFYYVQCTQCQKLFIFVIPNNRGSINFFFNFEIMGKYVMKNRPNLV